MPMTGLLLIGIVVPEVVQRIRAGDAHQEEEARVGMRALLLYGYHLLGGGPIGRGYRCSQRSSYSSLTTRCRRWCQKHGCKSREDGFKHSASCVDKMGIAVNNAQQHAGFLAMCRRSQSA
jgi:hypothetical protein